MEGALRRYSVLFEGATILVQVCTQGEHSLEGRRGREWTTRRYLNGSSIAL